MYEPGDNDVHTVPFRRPHCSQCARDRAALRDRAGGQKHGRCPSHMYYPNTYFEPTDSSSLRAVAARLLFPIGALTAWRPSRAAQNVQKLYIPQRLTTTLGHTLREKTKRWPDRSEMFSSSLSLSSLAARGPRTPAPHHCPICPPAHAHAPRRLCAP